jgi:hypothetical protein
MKLPNPVLMAYLAAAGVGVFVAWKLTRAASGAVDAVSGAAGRAVDAVKAGASTAADVATGNYDPIGDALGWHFYLGTQGWRLGDSSGSLNPADASNPIYTGISKAGEAITGQQGWNLGSWIYDITHKQ